jgi:hypothetical protein
MLLKIRPPRSGPDYDYTSFSAGKVGMDLRQLMTEEFHRISQRISETCFLTNDAVLFETFIVTKLSITMHIL